MKSEREIQLADNKEVMKKYNFNKFGRYNGGIPDRVGRFRGGARGDPGSLVMADEMHVARGAGTTSDLYTNREDMRANTNFYKSDIEYEQYRKTYFQADVEDFRLFKNGFRNFLFKYVIYFSCFFATYCSGKLFLEKRYNRVQKQIRRDNVEYSNGIIFEK